MSVSFHYTASTCHWKEPLPDFVRVKQSAARALLHLEYSTSHIFTQSPWVLWLETFVFISNSLSIYKTISFRCWYRPSFWEEAVKAPLLVTVKTRLANTLGILQTEECLLILQCSCFFTDLSLKYTKRHCFFKWVLGMLSWKFPEAVTDKGYLEPRWVILNERQKLAVEKSLSEKSLTNCTDVGDKF